MTETLTVVLPAQTVAMLRAQAEKRSVPVDQVADEMIRCGLFRGLSDELRTLSPLRIWAAL